MAKEKKPYPVLYVLSTRGSLFRNGSVNPTLHFGVVTDEARMKEDPEYAAYMDEMINKEIPQAIINKFVVSQPLYLTNDKIPFLLFNSNIDHYSLKEFCKAILQEISFHTGVRHSGVYGLDKTLLLEMNKNPGLLGSMHLSNKGEKLTRSEAMKDFSQPLEFEGDPMDQGIMCPFDIWKEEKRREALKEQQKSDDEEEIVLW